MIINGGSRSNGAFFAKHLMRADQNERVTVAEMRGFGYAEDVPEAFREMSDLASGTRIKNFFYHANINTRADEMLTPEQWQQAVDRLEQELHLEGQPRFVVEHDKEGRVHRHVVWSRIDTDSMTAISDSHNYRTHELVATELENTFGHEATARALTRDEETPRQERNVGDWESFRAQESKIDPKAMKAELTELWQHSDSGPAFVAALEERGYILARGDRRDFCVIDQAGDEHSLGRRISGVKAAELRARMEGIDRAALPSVEEARMLARTRPEEPADAPIERIQDEPETKETPAERSLFEAIMAERLAEERRLEDAAEGARGQKRAKEADTAFEAIMQERLQETAEHRQRETAAEPGGQWERFSGWLTTMREHVAGLAQQVRDYWSERFGHQGAEVEPDAAPPAETPTPSVQSAGATVEPIQQPQQGPELG